MTGEETRYEGIVLRLAPSGENDAVVTALGPSGCFSFLAKGIRKPNSKYGLYIQPLYRCSFLFRSLSSGLFLLKEADLLESLLPKENLDAFSLSSLLLELSLSFLQEEDGGTAYPWLYEALKAICSGSDPYCACLICFAHFLEIGGIGLDVDGCVLCGSRSQISTIDLTSGGFICQDCYDSERMGLVSRDVLKIYRYIFKAPISDYGRVELGATRSLPVLISLARYLNENAGVKLRSLSLLRK